jgi:CheY-like chemotaxis protein
LSNSKDATEGQEKREIVITSKIENSTLKIEFKDNGSGIPEKIIDQVVTPFFTTKEFGKGTGLGLAIVNSVVKEHGGELSIDSQMGKGTQINISLPVIRRIGPIEEIDKTVFDPKMLAGLNILIVDDEEPIRDLLEVFLEEVKANVTTAESGSKALEIIQNQNFDLAIVDVKMPGMSGPKLLESIRSQNNINQPKVLLVTGGLHLDLEDEGMGFFEKMDGFLYKPFTQGEIFQAVCRAIYKKEK